MKLSAIAEKLLNESNLDVLKMVASGNFPLPPNELIYIVSVYGLENKGGLKDVCINTLKSLPHSFFQNFFKNTEIPENIMLFLSIVFQEDIQKLEEIFKHPATPQKIYEIFARHSNSDVLRRLIEVESRWVNNPVVVDRLLENPKTPIDLLEKVKFYKKEPEKSKEEVIISYEDVVVTVSDREQYKEFVEEREVEDVEAKRSLSGKIAKLSVAEKIKLALMGNKEVRSILIKDSNKLVSSAVLKNPRITDGEVIKITQDKNVNDEIIRIICHNNNWTQIYAVRYNLVLHPKTPLQVALKFLSTLSTKDLATVAKSKNVPSALATNARKLLLVRSR